MNGAHAVLHAIAQRSKRLRCVRIVAGVKGRRQQTQVGSQVCSKMKHHGS